MIAMWKYKLGAVVRQKVAVNQTFVKSINEYMKPPELLWGHVSGFTNSGTKTLVVVEWEDGIETAYDPQFLQLEGE
jgi:hypothetical protein